jgi:8-oxo-dGTP pyrophosphatase MutT (NUDIX family)
MDMPFAVFVIAEKDGLIAAVTRDDGQFALPGGTVEQNESPYDAVCRESIEEGWSVEIDKNHIYQDFVDNKLIWWYVGKNPVKLVDFFEKGILETDFVSKDTIRNSGFCNDKAMEIYEQE